MKKLRLLPVLMLTLILFLSVGPSAAAAGNKVADGVWFGSKDLSGMTLTEATAAIEAYYKEIAASDLTINIRDIPAEPEKSAAEAAAPEVPSVPGTPGAADSQTGKKPLTPADYPIVFSVKVPISTLGFEYTVDDALRMAGSIGRSGRLIERYKQLMDLQSNHVELPFSCTVSGEAVRKYVEEVFVPENTREPENCEFYYDGQNFWISKDDVPGVTVDADKTAEAILAAFDQKIGTAMQCEAIVTTTPAHITNAAVDSVSNGGVVAQYRTFFNREGTNGPRAHNIDIGAEGVDGHLLMPGDSISIDEAMGSRVPENGYELAGAYSGGGVVMAYGGGVCQLATTIYQCVLQCELEVNERHNHSMAVDYVPFSMDATIDEGNKDLVFTNSWTTPIYIDCGTDSGSVYCRFFAEDPRPANRSIEYHSETYTYNEPPVVYNLDNTQNPAEPEVSGMMHPAVNSGCSKIVYVNGAVVSNELLYQDYYRPSQVTVTIKCNMLGLTQETVDGVTHIYDKYKNELILQEDGTPIFDKELGAYHTYADFNEDGTPKNPLTVPELNGMTVSAAKAALVAAGFNPEAILSLSGDARYDVVADGDYVYCTSPAAGTVTVASKAVTLISFKITAGETVPADIPGKSALEAKTALSKFRLSCDAENSAPVLSMSPAGGVWMPVKDTPLREGISAVITLECGDPLPSSAPVPAVIGMSVEAAKAALRSAGFTNISTADGYSDRAVVLSVTPGENSEVLFSAVITLTWEEPAEPGSSSAAAD